MSATLINTDAAFHRQPVQFEGREEEMQDTGVIGVLDVLDVELPVVRKHLSETPEHHRGAAAEHPLDAVHDLLAEIFLDRWHVFGERAENQTVNDRDAQLARTMLLHLEGLRHAALALDAILESDACQVALRV